VSSKLALCVRFTVRPLCYIDFVMLHKHKDARREVVAPHHNSAPLIIFAAHTRLFFLMCVVNVVRYSRYVLPGHADRRVIHGWELRDGSDTTTATTVAYLVAKVGATAPERAEASGGGAGGSEGGSGGVGSGDGSGGGGASLERAPLVINVIDFAAVADPASDERAEKWLMQLLSVAANAASNQLLTANSSSSSSGGGGSGEGGGGVGGGGSGGGGGGSGGGEGGGGGGGGGSGEGGSGEGGASPSRTTDRVICRVPAAVLPESTRCTVGEIEPASLWMYRVIGGADGDDAVRALTTSRRHNVACIDEY
jgi:hypothetical protein